MPQLPFVITLMGPTASGKTALSLFIADNMPVEIVSVDSALVYNDMNIGSSKPEREVLDKYPHHLINICSPENAYSAAQFSHDTERLIAEIHAREKIPLLVGGTMLYFRALIRGLSDMPGADESVRESLLTYSRAHGVGALYERLCQVDPVAAKKIHRNDPQRIQRALEVYELSGKPISQWWEEQSSRELPYSLIKLAVSTRERALLHKRIEVRFDQMLSDGFISEVEALRERGDLDLDKPSMRAVGYRQIWQYLDGDYCYDTMREKGIIATRQLAKRQLTWLRSEPGLQWFYSDNEGIESDVLSFLKSHLE